jgi:hypothetical protein
MFYPNMFQKTMIRIFHRRLFVVSCRCCLLALMAMACGDDVEVEKIVNIPGDTVRVTPKSADASITSFTVGAGGEALKASVRGDSIYLYWPVYLAQPAHIAPVINVATQAAVQPASGAEVVFETGVTYTVTSEDGTERKYKLKKVINQPVPWVEGTAAIEVGSSLFLNGDFFIPDADLTHVFLQNAAGAVELAISSISETQIVVAVPADMPVGPYKLKVHTGWRVTYDRLFEQLEVRYPAPALSNPEGMTLHPGDTYVLQGTNLRSITAVRALSVTDGLYYPLEIVTYDVASITLKIPKNFTLGQYNAYQLDSEWATDGIVTRTLSTSRRLTVDASPE